MRGFDAVGAGSGSEALEPTTNGRRPEVAILDTRNGYVDRGRHLMTKVLTHSES